MTFNRIFLVSKFQETKNRKEKRKLEANLAEEIFTFSVRVNLVTGVEHLHLKTERGLATMKGNLLLLYWKFRLRRRGGGGGGAVRQGTFK